MKEENVKALFNEYIENIRRVFDTKDTNYVFDNQIETAKEIIYNFFTNEDSRWNLLFAEMQSGKSGTFFSIPYIISRNALLVKKLGIDMFDDEINVFLLTGMNEKELIVQFEKDINGFTGMDITKNVLHNSEMSKFLKNPEYTWNETDKTVIDRMRKNSLILIDESHYGSDKDQILDKFLRQILKINPNGDNAPLKENNIYVVSISATPMSEFINANVSDFSKKIVPLKNATGYYGICDMFVNNKIFNAYDLKPDSIDKFLDKTLNNKKTGYILVRCNQKQQDSIEKKIGDRMLDFNRSIDYNSLSKKNILDNQGINDILTKTPSKKTIIYLKGLLRAGKRVDTRNVIMVHDTATSNVDTTVQSLLGRCCGYGKNQDIDIYCDRFSAEKYKNWIESGYHLDSVPDKSKNVLAKGKSKYSLNKIKILKYDLKSDFEKNYKKNNTKSAKKIILESYIDEKEYLSNHYYIGSFYDKSSKTITPLYDSKNGYLCDNDMYGNLDNEFDTDLEKGIDPVGKYVITTLIDKKSNKIEFSIGEITHQVASTSEKSMYHETNIL